MDEPLNIEALRAEATDALARFTPDDRRLASEITHKHISLYDIASDWSNHLKDLFENLESSAEQTRVHNYIAKHFYFREQSVGSMIDSIVEARQIEELDRTITKRFRAAGQEGSEAHLKLIDFLLLEPIGVIDAYFERARTYQQAFITAETHDFTLCDPHGSWLERQRSAAQIQKERHSIQQQESDRLDEIAETITAIQDDRDSILSRIIAMDWQYTTVLDLRQRYQRNVAKLKTADQTNPAKQIRIFERVTKDFREDQTERLARRTKTHSLKGIRDIQEGVYDLLLEIFDLTNTQRSHLLSEIQRYTALRQERDMILLLQRNREQFMEG